MRGLLLVSSLGLVACSAPNPAYDGSGPGQGTTQGSSTGLASTTDPTQADGSSGAVCELGDSRPLALSVTFDGEVEPPDCTVDYVEFPLGANLYAPTGNSVAHEECEPLSCDCVLEPPQYNIILAEDRAFAEGIGLPDCGRVSMWARENPSGDCEWAGLVLWEVDEPLVPWYIASRTLDVPPFAAAGAPFELELANDESCDELEICGDMGRRPGRYAIDVLGYQTVTMDESPPLLELPFGAPGETRNYLFDNRAAILNRDCDLEVSWTAGMWL